MKDTEQQNWQMSVSGPGNEWTITADKYSDRVRCDHPVVSKTKLLRQQLEAVAKNHAHKRIVVFANSKIAPDFVDAGFKVEAVIPKYYRGEADCAVLAKFMDDRKRTFAHPIEREAVLQLVDRKGQKETLPVVTERATLDDATEIARLLGATFDAYPTPSADPEYISKQIQDGIPFRVVRVNGRVVGCASADLIRSAKTAELTDCATNPEFRRRGYMQAILHALMDDLRALSYPTAFTLARARIPGMNLAFRRLGFTFRGTMAKSCRIGEGIEDMNVWSRRL